MSLLAELKRRKVFKVGAAYLVVAWLAVQAASIALPTFEAPLWALRIFILIALLGFPIAVVMAWVFDITPEGIKLDASASGSKRLFAVAILLIALALGWYFYGQPSFRRGDMTTAAHAPVTTAVAIPRKSIAVLPFTDLSPGHDQEYFSDGMAEEILDELAQVQDLKVAARTSSFSFKGKNEKIQAIGEALGVANVLEGSVRTQGNQVRITAQLIQARDGFHLWSESYNGDMKDVFQLQERIARAVTDKLKVILQDEQKTRLVKQTTDSGEAHQQFLRGRYFWNRRGLANLQDAAIAFKAALAADPDYADAWAGLAQTYALIPEYSSFDPAYSGPVIDTVPQALEAAEHALRLDPASSRALSARAYVRCVHKFDWAGAEADYRAAIVSDPRDPSAHQWYGELLMYERRWDESAVQYDAAIALDPLAPITHLSRSLNSWYRGNLEAARSDLQEAHRLSPELYYATVNLTSVLIQLRRYDETRSVASELPVGVREAVLSLIDAMQDPSKSDVAAQLILAHGPGGVVGKPLLLALLGKNDLVLTELERLFRARDPYRVFIYAAPQFNPLHDNPRFQALLKQIGLPRAGDKP